MEGSEEKRGCECTSFKRNGTPSCGGSSRSTRRGIQLSPRSRSQGWEKGREECKGPSSSMSHSTGLREHDTSHSRSRQSQLELYGCQSHDPQSWLTGLISRVLRRRDNGWPTLSSDAPHTRMDLNVVLEGTGHRCQIVSNHIRFSKMRFAWLAVLLTQQAEKASVSVYIAIIWTHNCRVRLMIQS